MQKLQVNKKSIEDFFSEMQGKKFVIPDYQRPYQWDLEKCETLWSDIIDFFQNDYREKSDYFLGSVVTFINQQGNQEVIDGQQRITSLMLMLRAFYKKLESMVEDREVIGLKSLLAPCLWDVASRRNAEVEDFTKVHIVSEVANESDNHTFHKILETGEAGDKAKDNYSKNYLFFKKKCDEYAAENPMSWNGLCEAILTNCILLPIECDTQNTALTIFSTLNDRGMPLSDSDIFKAQIYRNYANEEERKAFTEDWRELSEICTQNDFTINDLFRYYTHIIRARKSDNSKEIGLRRFYAQNSYEFLKEPNLMEELKQLAIFWQEINNRNSVTEENSVKLSITTRKFLHCLNCYPNEYWKYILSVFYIKNRESEDFDKNLQKILKKLVAFLFAKFIEAPSVNYIKDDIFNSYISIYQNNQLNYRFSLNKESISTKMKDHYSSRISRALQLLYAYLDEGQKELIPTKFEIEHIFPRKWQNTNYNGWNREDADIYLNTFGNKVVIEKKLNIQAGNNYFGNKKKSYIHSHISVVKKLANYPKEDWVKEDITRREKEFQEKIIQFFEEYL